MIRGNDICEAMLRLPPEIPGEVKSRRYTVLAPRDREFCWLVTISDLVDDEFSLSVCSCMRLLGRGAPLNSPSCPKSVSDALSRPIDRKLMIG